MNIQEMVSELREKAAFYDDDGLALIAQQLDFGASLAELKPARNPYALYSVRSAAEFLSLSVDYVWKLIAMGKLPSVKIGKRRLVRLCDLEAFVQREVDAYAT